MQFGILGFFLKSAANYEKHTHDPHILTMRSKEKKSLQDQKVDFTKNKLSINEMAQICKNFW